MIEDMLDGVINLNKPGGITSQETVSRVKRILRARRAGHAGTLDPEATGVLLVCVGKATKIAPFLMGTSKGYMARMKLGEETDTQDAWGKVVKSSPVPPLGREEIETALMKFRGEVQQVPPMYSALKVKGRRLYSLARKGQEIEREPRGVYIPLLALEEFSSPFLRLNIRCSKGTYVRTLCHDLGALLGCGAHLVALQRMSVGSFKIQDALSLEELDSLALKGKLEEALLPMDEALSFLPALMVEEKYVERVLHGAPVQAEWAAESTEAFAPGDAVRVKSRDGRLLAVGEAVMGSQELLRGEEGSQALKMRRVLAESSP